MSEALRLLVAQELRVLVTVTEVTDSAIGFDNGWVMQRRSTSIDTFLGLALEPNVGDRLVLVLDAIPYKLAESED